MNLININNTGKIYCMVPGNIHGPPWKVIGNIKGGGGGRGEWGLKAKVFKGKFEAQVEALEVG